MEEYSEGKIHKSEPKPGNGNVNTVYFVIQARGNTRISRTAFVYNERARNIANVNLYLSGLLRNLVIENILFFFLLISVTLLVSCSSSNNINYCVTYIA